MVIVKATKESEAGVLPSTELLAPRPPEGHAPRMDRLGRASPAPCRLQSGMAQGLNQSFAALDRLLATLN
jgi:hypothetical protein